MAMVGNSRQCAPSSLRMALNSLACSRARVTTMRRPNSGRASNQLSSPRSRTTSPTTVMAGGLRFAAATLAAISRRVPMTVCCSGVVPQRITATGVSPDRPCSISMPQISGRFLTPMKNTRVPTPVASRSQVILEAVLSSRS